MMALGVGDLKEFLAEAVAADASFAHVYANKEKAQLAFYEWASARWNFTTQLSGLPAALKKEKEKQLREAAIARGEVVPDLAVKPAKKKIKMADFKAQADRLCPDGISAPAVAVPPRPPPRQWHRRPPRQWRRWAGTRPAPWTLQRRWAMSSEATSITST